MPGIGLDVQRSHLGVGDLDTLGIAVLIQFTSHRQVGFGGRSGDEIDHGDAPADQRGGVLSAIYLLSYLLMGATAVVLGVVATASSLGLAVDLGAGAIAVLSLATLLLAASGRGCAPHALPS
jgi:hypothetical protein